MPIADLICCSHLPHVPSDLFNILKHSRLEQVLDSNPSRQSHVSRLQSNTEHIIVICR